VLSLRAILPVLAVLALMALVPAAEARPPEPGADCDVKEEYVTESALTRDPNGLPSFQPGAPRPIECYY
jgi:hypothetical protein